MPLDGIGLMKVEVTPNLKIVSCSILQDGLKIVGHHTQHTMCSSNIENLEEILREYINGKTGPEMLLPYLTLPDGLQGLVLLAVLAIPRGRVAAYSQIAEITRTHPRVVGKVVAKNRVPVLIPCHRVVQVNGQLGGYTCGVDVKRRLLELEGVYVQPSGKVDRKFFVDTEELKQRFLVLYREYVRMRGAVEQV